MTTSPEAIIDAIEEQIRQSTKLVQAGRDVALDGLELKVAMLCTAIEAMPRQEGQIFQKKLETLVLRLSDLGGELRHGRDAVHEQLNKLDLQRKASIAYGTTNIMDNSIAKNKKDS